ncbi:carboxyltransferase domain-containing protein [Comamonas sp. J-3]|uniref:5-oxoprolinase subunit B/C family protein n=1 Tax=Comamonas trifloxystrobinivorans TaxID=3350256 RepID=UPI0037274B97
MSARALRFLPVSDRILLVELQDLAHTLDLLAALQAALPPGVRELVPAARTILIEFDRWQTSAAELRRHIAALPLGRQNLVAGQRVEIPVHYDGEDLAEVAQLLGIDVAELVRRHTAEDYSVAFCGFAPGFAYLSGGHASLNVPRRSSPRTKVPAGSVALAGTFSAVYPNDTPGGWQLLGRTEVPMWDLQRNPPALLQPGMRVRFVDAATASVAGAASTDSSAGKTQTSSGPAVPATTRSQASMLVRAPGLQTLVQDAGRAGQAGQGVSAAGALDQAAMRRANRLLGNAENLPVLEAAAGGLQLQSVGATVVAVTGATGTLKIQASDGCSWFAERNAALALNDGDVLQLGEPATGVRSYVAVRGGWLVEQVLGSASTDTLARIGPPALAAGMALAIGDERLAGAVQAPDLAPPVLPQAGDTVVLDVVMGPRTDWFTPEAVARFAEQRWLVTPQSNRVGLRLAGDEALVRSITQELPSEGTALGAIQVPASGQPVLFLADHPLTGGYPVIACIASHHIDLAGQVPVGAFLQFRVLQPFAEIA